MKPSVQLNKCGSSNVKSKKSSKDREKRKPQGSTPEINNHNTSEKGSPLKDCSTKLYAGIDSDSLIIYAEQTGIEHLTDEITNTLTEDINYKLRYIINDSLIKARLSGRNSISSQDIDQIFENLQIDKVYGAPSHPNWVPFGYQNLCYLDDKQINLAEMALEENVYHQYVDTVVKTKWIPDQKEVSKALRNYYITMCQMIVSNDIETQRLVLKNIAENPRIGPIVEWFYNFSYILLSKDITYDCLTLRALDLITTLEHSQICRINVSEKQLKLLVRLILQRLLKSVTTYEILKPICNVLAILCERMPLKEFVLLKLQQKIKEVFDNYDLAVITIINCLGIAAVENIFLLNFDLFINTAIMKKDSPFIYSILETYHILHKGDLINSSIYSTFFDYFGESLLAFVHQPHVVTKGYKKRDLNITLVKRELLKTRRKITAKPQQSTRIPIEEVFSIPGEKSKLKNKIDNITLDECKKHTSVVVGRTTLLLPVFQRKIRKCHTRCYDHVLWYTF